MSGDDFEKLVDVVNRSSPGSARFVELTHTGHIIEHYDTLADAFAGQQQRFDDRIALMVRDWFIRHMR